MNAETFVDGLTEVLLKRKVITAQQAGDLKKIFHDSSKPNFDEFLLDEGIVEKDDLLRALGEYYQVPPFDAVGYFFDHQLVRMFPKEFLRSNAIVPIELDENILVMLASNPADLNILPRIGRYVSYDIQFRVGLLQDIYDAIQEFYDQSLTGLDYDQGLDENKKMREGALEQEEEVEDMADDFTQEK